MAEQIPDKLFCLLGINIGGDLGALTIYKNKRGKLVWFPKSPPLKPPSPKQSVERNRFRLAALCWKSITPTQREQYNLAARRSSLTMTGYNLHLHFRITRDEARKTTIARQTNTVLV